MAIIHSLACLCFALFSVAQIHGNSDIDVQEQDTPTADFFPVCECRSRLIPKVQGVYETLWTLTGIFEKALMYSAVAVSAIDKNDSPAVEANPNARSFDINVNHIGSSPFISKIRNLLKLIPTGISSVFLQRGNVHVSNEDCPLLGMSEAYSNLTHQLTDACHFMSDVENNKEMAVLVLNDIRMMVMEMNNETEKFHTFFDLLNGMQCPDSLEKQENQTFDGRSFNITGVDCNCIKELVPEITKMVDVLLWLLHILHETQAFCALTLRENPKARAAPGELPYKENILRIILDFDFHESFRKESIEQSKSLEKRSVNESEVESCPLDKVLEHRRSLESTISEAIHDRENAKNDKGAASLLFDVVSKEIVMIEKKLKEYNEDIVEFKSRNC